MNLSTYQLMCNQKQISLTGSCGCVFHIYGKKNSEILWYVLQFLKRHFIKPLNMLGTIPRSERTSRQSVCTPVFNTALAEIN